MSISLIVNGMAHVCDHHRGAVGRRDAPGPIGVDRVRRSAMRILPVGQIMAAVDLLKRKPKPTEPDINREITNICRCGT